MHVIYTVVIKLPKKVQAARVVDAKITRRLCFTVRTSRRPPVHRPNQAKSVSRVVAVGERIAVWSSLMST